VHEILVDPGQLLPEHVVQQFGDLRMSLHVTSSSPLKPNRICEAFP
jgi:hypothetical protein